MKLPVIGVIMAGGCGERFWPISRRLKPKQLLHLTSDSKTMIEEAVDRLLPIIPRERILIATSSHLQDSIRSALPDHPVENVIGEPLRRNTSGCLAFAAAHALARFDYSPDEMLMSVTTADHLIGDDERFRDTITASLQFAEEDDALVTIGVHPTRPETGYGYIQINQLNQPITDSLGIPVYKVSQFMEKPNLEDAERYQASRFYYWNSGMFFWKMSTFINGLEKAMPSMAQSINGMKEIIARDQENHDELERLFKPLPDISIDKGLMEKADNVYVALGDFRWDDVGSWDSLSRIRARDAQRNTTVGQPILIDCKNVIAYNEPGQNEMAVCAVGVENLIIVTTKDAVLVCPKDRAQDVRQAVHAIQERQLDQS